MREFILLCDLRRRSCTDAFGTDWLRMDAFAPEESDRSLYMSFDALVNTETKSSYHVVCQ